MRGALPVWLIQFACLSPAAGCGRIALGWDEGSVGRWPTIVWRVHVYQFIVRRLGMVAGSTVVLWAMVGAGVFLLPVASADRIVKGCTIVAHPKLQHHASCGGANLSFGNLSRANLSYADLTHANLTHANLSRTNLSHANLSESSLRGANLSHASLSHGDLTNADLSHANLSQAVASHANLSHANLFHTDLSHADLHSADLTDANLSHTRFCHTTMPDGHVDNSGC
jgi:hypothetical protein